ncbi:MAG: DUF488 domain-containing protein, partial [Roseburia sp.]|nr:DUF488 domain-containing protein [Roseburia sp.]
RYKNGGLWEDYTREYNNTVLKNIMAETVYQELMQMSGGQDVVLLCYEKSSDNCHRHLVREWLNKASIGCKEYTF